MAGINKAIIVGRIGKDPEVRHTQDGKAIANFSIATSEEWKDKNTGQKQEKTEWHRIVAFGRLGEICGEYLSKGKQVYIEGRIQTRQWEKDGITRYTTEIVANIMQMLGDRGQGAPQQGQQGQQNQQRQSPQNSGPAPTPPDDEIPF